MYSLLSQRRLRWLGHVHGMNDGRILKEVLHGQLTTGESKLVEIDPHNLEVATSDRACWRWTVKDVIERADLKRHKKAEKKRARRKRTPLCPPPTSSALCAVETATRTLAHTVTQDIASPQALFPETSPANNVRCEENGFS